MKRKQTLCALLACLMLLGCTVKVSAVKAIPELVSPCAVAQFGFEVAAYSYATSSSSLTMAKGEKVTISATYSPASASVYCGVVDENGTFQYLSSTNGSINGSIPIKANGSYQLVVYNNASVAITISGTVNY